MTAEKKATFTDQDLLDAARHVTGSDRQTAERLGVRPSFISRIRSGSKSMPWRHVGRVCAWTGTGLTDLMASRVRAGTAPPPGDMARNEFRDANDAFTLAVLRGEYMLPAVPRVRGRRPILWIEEQEAALIEMRRQVALRSAATIQKDESAELSSAGFERDDIVGSELEEFVKAEFVKANKRFV